MFRDNGKGLPGDEISVVSPADRAVHFRVEMATRHAEAVEAGWSFKSVASALGKDVSLGQSTLRGVGYSKIRGVVSRPTDWPTGIDHVDLALDGRTALSMGYTCGVPPAAPTR